MEQLRQSKTGETTAEDANGATKKEGEKKVVPFSFENDPGSNNSGFYELQVCPLFLNDFVVVQVKILKTSVSKRI